MEAVVHAARQTPHAQEDAETCARLARPLARGVGGPQQPELPAEGRHNADHLPPLKRFHSSGGRLRTCGFGCVTALHESRVPSPVAAHGSPVRSDTNGTIPAITTASVRLAAIEPTERNYVMAG